MCRPIFLALFKVTDTFLVEREVFRVIQEFAIVGEVRQSIRLLLASRERVSPRRTLLTKVWSATDLRLYRQRELKSGASPRIGAGPKTAAMRLNDPAADGEPHTCSIRLGGEKRLKDALRASFGKPNPGIAHGNKQLTILSPRRGNAQFAALLLHGLDAVKHEVH